MEAKIQKHIYTIWKRLKDKYMDVLGCKHNWNHHGQGYWCEKCNYFTGKNHKLNKLIEKLLKHK